MRLTPARRARRRIDPFVTLRTLSRKTFFTRFAVNPLDSPDFFPLAIVVEERGLSTTHPNQNNNHPNMSSYRRFVPVGLTHSSFIFSSPPQQGQNSNQREAVSRSWVGWLVGFVVSLSFLMFSRRLSILQSHKNSKALATQATHKLQVTRERSHAVRVQCSQVRIAEKANHEGLGRLLNRGNRRALETQASLV